jgi:hypothetical protein
VRPWDFASSAINQEKGQIMTMTTRPFVVSHPPQFTMNGGQIIAVLLTGGPIFTHMTQITVQSNGANPTQGTLIKAAGAGTINASSTEFTQVCDGVQGMQNGDERTLEITGDENAVKDVVSAVSVDPHAAAAARLSDVRDLRVNPDADTGTGTEG